MGSAPEPSPKSSQLDEVETRRRQGDQRLEAHEAATELSQGERLLPFVYAAMETCGIYAALCVLAVVGLGGNSPILPLWGPFIPLAAAIWFSHAQAARSDDEGSHGALSSSPVLRILIFVLLALLVIWGGVYAATIPLYNPGWLLASVNDMLLLRPEGYRSFLVLIISALLFWRGLVIARRRVEPGDVLNTLRIGLGVIVFALVVTSASGGSAGLLTLFLVVVLFLSFTLVAHSLARASFLRLSHLRGLEGSVAGQERSILTVVGAVCLALCFVGLILVAFVSPDFLTQVQGPLSTIYNAVATAFATVAVVLVTPLFWLFSLLHVQFQPPQTKPPAGPKQPPPPPHHSQPSSAPSPFLFTLEVLGAVLIVALICLLVWFIWRRLKRRDGLVGRKHRAENDVRESLWSWTLFKSQLLLLLKALWRRFFPGKEASENEMPHAMDEINAEPAARTIREIYRALLQWAAQQGLRRKQEETPYEFEKRLSAHLSAGEHELQVVTDAYLLTRYGGYVPDEGMVGHVQQEWQAFRQKANSLSQP